ncbi:alpha-L-rhamnosidase [Conexibacter woesei]|uniref:alpha-L-rhamnosidase n=1 Tax=Conexibacter woesei TaxID=191495 RepID=UPI0003072AF7|nr:alpha-L-rhamnosidase [Conexibacter woesei]
MGELRGERLRCERLSDPLAVEPARPRLSWIAAAAAAPGTSGPASGAGASGAAAGEPADAAVSRGQRPTAYRVLAASSLKALSAVSERLAGGGERRGGAHRLPAGGRDLLWDSGRVAAAETLAVEWGGAPLAPCVRVFWRVLVWDRDGRVGPPSAIATFGAGLGDGEDAWGGAQWLGHGHPWAEHTPAGGDELDPLHNMGMTSALLRTEFALTRPVVRATAYATARGVYRLRLNGARVGDDELAPGWTDYRRRIHYQAFDLTRRLRSGANALGVELGEGWYAGYVGWMAKHAGGHYGARPSALVHVRVEHADGSLTLLSTDGGGWRATRGPRVYSDLQMGERFDARLVEAGWDEPGFDDAGWEQAVVHAPPAGARLEAQPCEPARALRELAPIALTEPRPGTWVFDLGQNLVGWARLRAAGPRGTAVTLRFGELLRPDGTLYTDNLRTAAARDTFVLAGRDDGTPEQFEPAFTFHGFRYVELTGLPTAPALADLTACVVHSDAPWAGEFACSHELLNAIARNAEWGQRGNFLSIPTDCPQRDERLGWLADTQVFAATALRNMDCTAFLSKWLQDVRDAQADDGAFPDVAPLPPAYDVLSHGAPGWGDGGVIVPWLVWRASGERAVLAAHYPAMVRWMEHLAALNPSHLRRDGLYNSYGDWLNVDAQTPKDLLATAYWALDARLLEQIARELGHEPDATRWRALHARVAAAFGAEWVAADGSLRTPTQTGYLLALHAELLPPALRASAAAHLAADVVARGRRLSTGFIGTGLLCPLLTEHGHAELAYDLALADTHPSWGATVRAGATTMWERWDGWSEDGGFASPNMNSFNHYAFGAIGEWLHRHVAGLDQHPDVPGWGHVWVRPQLDARLTWARAAHDSPRGPVRAGWELRDGELTLDVEIPPGAVGTVFVPGGDAAALRESGRPLADVAGVRLDGIEGDRIVVHVDSGRYVFTHQEGRDGDD